jgi:hypothetical protein
MLTVLQCACTVLLHNQLDLVFHAMPLGASHGCLVLSERVCSHRQLHFTCHRLAATQQQCH